MNIYIYINATRKFPTENSDNPSIKIHVITFMFPHHVMMDKLGSVSKTLQSPIWTVKLLSTDLGPHKCSSVPMVFGNSYVPTDGSASMDQWESACRNTSSISRPLRLQNTDRPRHHKTVSTVQNKNVCIKRLSYSGMGYCEVR